jgi:hypothetical protein
MPKVNCSLETLEDFESKLEVCSVHAESVTNQLMTRKRQGSDKIAPLETLPEDTMMDGTVEAIKHKPGLMHQNTMYESADVVTFVSNMNVCFGIFKNPSDHMTHFYSKRIKGNLQNTI